MSELPAGRELDALIAEKVMGLTLLKQKYPGGLEVWFGTRHVTTTQGPGDKCIWSSAGHPFGFFAFWQPSTDIRAALQVLEHMSPAKRVGQAYLPCITLNAPVAEGQWPDDVPLGRWIVEWFDGVQTLSCEDAETAPLAICRAALKAVGI